MKHIDLSLSLLEEFLLLALKGKERYGLDIRNHIALSSCGRYTVQPGNLYPTLERLEKRGLIVGRWGEDRPESRKGARRKYYTITADGDQALEIVDAFRLNLKGDQPVLDEAEI